MPATRTLAILFVLALTTPAFAQQKGRKVAFLVGVGEFAHDLQNLNGSPQRDVTALAAILREGDFEVVVLTDKDATRAAVEKQFKAVIEGDAKRAKLTNKDLLLVGICTHGFTLSPAPGQPDAPFLATHDSKLDKPETMVSLNGMIAEGKSSGATVLYLIDACREIADANRGATRGVGPTQVVLPKGTAILFSCGRGQLSHQNADVGGHGLFTHAVLQTLRGKAGIKDEVSWSGLVAEVEKQFRSTAFQKLIPAGKPQRPVAASGEIDTTDLMPIGGTLAADEQAYRAAENKSTAQAREHLRAVVPMRLAAWRESAEKGNPAGQVFYGRCFTSGIGVSENDSEAVKWYRKAADAGNGAGMFSLGMMYDKGYGVMKDGVKAIEWYKNAANAGHAGAMFNLGMSYEAGDGVAEDEVEAVKWFKKAADAEHLRAMMNLGWMHENGRGGLTKDEAEAVKWYKKAAALGNELAKKSLKRLGKE